MKKYVFDCRYETDDLLSLICTFCLPIHPWQPPGLTELIAATSTFVPQISHSTWCFLVRKTHLLISAIVFRPAGAHVASCGTCLTQKTQPCHPPLLHVLWRMFNDGQ